MARHLVAIISCRMDACVWMPVFVQKLMGYDDLCIDEGFEYLIATVLTDNRVHLKWVHLVMAAPQYALV
jgi:hypothetical protein